MTSIKKMEGKIYTKINHLLDPYFHSDFYIANKKQFYDYTIKYIFMVFLFSMFITSTALVMSDKASSNSSTLIGLMNLVIIESVAFSLFISAMHTFSKVDTKHPYYGNILKCRLAWSACSFVLCLVAGHFIPAGEYSEAMTKVLNNSDIAVLENNARLTYSLGVVLFFYTVYEYGFKVWQLIWRNKLGNQGIRDVAKLMSVTHMPPINSQVIHSEKK